jgi:four helix bundle protein
MADFKKLQVWQKAHALSLTIDRMCKRIRGAEYSSLKSQLFRAAMSIPANIAEGRSKNSDKDFGRFLRYAVSSCSEIEHHLGETSQAERNRSQKQPAAISRPADSSHQVVISGS